MVKILTLLLCLGSQTALAVNGSGNVSSIVGFGGATNPASPPITEPLSSYGSDGCFSIVSSAQSAGAGNYYQFIKADGTIYQVASGKIFKTPGFYLHLSAAGGLIIGTATATFTNNSASVPTGAKNYTVDTSSPWFQATAADTNGNYYPREVTFTGGTFPFMRADTGSATYIMSMRGCEY